METRKQPDWIDKEAYPFKSNWISLKNGTLHYVDEGQGEVLLFLHGNPVWSYSFRKLITAFSKNYRCIAIDHLGFGLSDKPAGFSYLPADHSINLTEFIDQLGLKNISLFVNDWGGPIGLNYAVNHAENIKRLIIFNTMMWSVKGDKHFERFSGFMGGRIGKFLNIQFNFFGKFVIPKAWGDKSKLDKKTKYQLVRHVNKSADRIGVWMFPKEIIGSSEWMDTIWQKRNNIENVPAFLIWGMKDIAFRQKELDRFCGFLKKHQVTKLENVGHYVQDEGAELIISDIAAFLKKTS